MRPLVCINIALAFVPLIYAFFLPSGDPQIARCACAACFSLGMASVFNLRPNA